MNVSGTSTSIVLTKYSIDQQYIHISKNSIFNRTHKWKIGTLAALARKNLKFLFSGQGSITNKQKGIIVPTLYVIDQQDIEILKYHNYDAKCENTCSAHS